MSEIYLFGKICNGSGRGDNHLTMDVLKYYAKLYNLKIPSGLKKEEVCKLFIANGIGVSGAPSVSVKNSKSTKAANVPVRSANVPVRAANVPVRAANVPAKAANVPVRTANVPAKAANVPASKRNTDKIRYSDLEDLMATLDVIDARDLMELTPAEMEAIISTMKLSSGKVKMTDYMKNTEGVGKENERAKKFLKTLAEKYCRCLKGVEPQGDKVKPNAICNKTIFNDRGLKAPGAAYQCTPTPLLLAPKGKTYVLEKSK